MGTQARCPSISSFLQTKAKDIDDKRTFTFSLLNKENQEHGYRRSLASLGMSVCVRCRASEGPEPQTKCLMIYLGL